MPARGPAPYAYKRIAESLRPGLNPGYAAIFITIINIPLRARLDSVSLPPVDVRMIAHDMRTPLSALMFS